MTNEVLYVFFFCCLSFLTGRVMVSNKQTSNDFSQPLFGLLVLGSINYVALYEHWWLAGPALLVSYFFGFSGKDSLRLPLRNNVRPKIRKTVGTWGHQPKAKSDDDHSDVGIGS